MKRPKRVTARLKGIAIAAENAKSGTPRQPSMKKEPRKDQVHQVSVQTRSASASKPSKKNKKVGDLYQLHNDFCFGRTSVLFYASICTAQLKYSGLSGSG